MLDILIMIASFSLWFVLLLMIISLRTTETRFIDLILFMVLVVITDVIATDVLRLSVFFDWAFFFGAVVVFEFLYFLFTKQTEIVTVSAKAKQVNTFGTNNVIKTTNDKTFTINNDFFIQWYAKKLNKKIRIGHKYKITTYRLLFTGRNILSATEIKTVKRKVTKK